jgi:transmembrane sensor
MTADPSRTDPTSSIENSAAEWAVRLSLNTLTASEQTELEAWLAAGTRHQGALLRAQAAWLDLDRVAALSAHSNDFSTSHSTAKAIFSSRAAVPARRRSPSQSRRFFLAAGVGAIALTGASGAFWLRRRHGEVYESAVGEIRQVTLVDGSTMHLDSATKVLVRFSESRREIELVSGQGFFEVTKDPARPFVVLARGVSVRAVGTAFTVRAVDQDVAITVTEGVVEVADGQAGGSARVTADQRAVVSAADGIEVQAVPAAQVERHLAWRNGMLSFDGESLAEAVKELNRHNSRHIEIDDPALAIRPIVGIFRAADTDGFARAVAAALGAERADENDAIHLRLRARP